jgi:hypothetical protein
VLSPVRARSSSNGRMTATLPTLPSRAVDDAAQLRAESKLLRSALLGAGVGAFVCSAIWVGLVAIATVGKGIALAPTLAMAAGCGVFAGLFLGGYAGALTGSRWLEEVDHERMHGAQHTSVAG